MVDGKLFVCVSQKVTYNYLLIPECVTTFSYSVYVPSLIGFGLPVMAFVDLIYIILNVRCLNMEFQLIVFLDL